MLDLLKQVTHSCDHASRSRRPRRCSSGSNAACAWSPCRSRTWRGWSRAARVTLDERVPTIGVFASGRLVANPQFVGRLKDNELVFVLAHEMLHLALRTHDRAKGADRLEFNYAHDYIINDILRTELGMPVPAGGLDMPGAREKSAEEIVLEMRRNQQRSPRRSVWQGEATSARRALRRGRRAARQGTRRPATCSTPPLEARAVSRRRRRTPAPGRSESGSWRPRRSAWRARWASRRGCAAPTPAPQARRCWRCAASTARPGSSRCSAGSSRSRRATGPSAAPRAAAPSAPTSSCRAAAARGGSSTSCSTPAAR